MPRSGGASRIALRGSVLGLAGLLAIATFADNANARARRHYRHHHRAAAEESYQPSQASIVVDANTGAVLEASNADGLRHPASLTKIMTLYLLFERLDAGKIKLSTEFPVSAHAASMAPSKLDLKPGDSIRVETAIKAIVTKSANDVAVVVAEALGGSEEEFARMMTAKAHALGMMHTTYVNASGLPDDRQITTARDVALLGRAIQQRFPDYYKYFSTRIFDYHGHPIRNHNHLLGVVPGVDGIKTGYIHESGFNIVTSVRRGGRHIVAAVFGGRTARARDARMRDLIDGYIQQASTKPMAAPLVARSDSRESKERKLSLASASPEPKPGSTAPIKPIPVKTFAVRGAAMKAASVAAGTPEGQELSPSSDNTASITTVATVKHDPPPLPSPPPGVRPGVLGTLPAKVASAANDDEPGSTTVAAKSHGGWMIQVGAFDQEGDAKERLGAVKIKIESLLAHAEPFTERVEKGHKALFRARFAGLDKHQAESACKRLRHSDIPCMLLKN